MTFPGATFVEPGLGAAAFPQLQNMAAPRAGRTH